MKSQPILALKNGETVEAMMYDQARQSAIIGTSSGRILVVRNLCMNAYMGGSRTVYASATGKCGVEVEAGHQNVRYGLVNKLLEATAGREITRWKTVDRAAGIDRTSASVGVFTTPVLWAGENFGWWGDMSWGQVVPDGCRVAVQVRVAASADAVLESKWSTFEESASGAMSKGMDDMSIVGSYAQVRVMLESAGEDTPSVSALVLPFFTRHVSYFFTVKMVMKKGTDIKGGLLVATASVPRNTDVKWGVASKTTANWNDYVEVEPGKMFSLPDGFGDRLRIGARMVSYDDERYPTIEEFAMAFDSGIDNLVEQQA